MILLCFIQTFVMLISCHHQYRSNCLLITRSPKPALRAGELHVLVIGALYQTFRMLGIIEIRKVDREVGPLFAFGDLLSAYHHNKAFDVEAGTLNPAVVHHGTPPLEEKSREG